MLPRSHRLPSSEIPIVMRHGKRVSAEPFLVIAQKSEADVSRFAYSISTKTDKRATRRNRMKRLISESIFHLLPRFHNHTDCIFIVRKDFSEKRQAEVEMKISEVLEKAGLLE